PAARRRRGACSQRPQWLCRLCPWSAGGHFAVGPVAELLDESRTGWAPIEVGSRLGRVGALVEQEDFGEIVAEARPGLSVGAGDRPGSAGGDRRRLRELGNG